MSQTYHLIKRNGVWSYRRRVPTHLVRLLGKKTIQFSLHTASLKEAKKRRAAEDLKWSTRFEARSHNGENLGENCSPCATSRDDQRLNAYEVR